jgi:hypothetical protein
MTATIRSPLSPLWPIGSCWDGRCSSSSEPSARASTYADDLVIVCRRGKAEAALQSLREIVGELVLTVNEEKTRICKAREGSSTSWDTRSGECLRRGPAKPVSATGHQRKGLL